MKFKYLIIAAGLGIIGFLFYPRSEDSEYIFNSQFIKPVKIVDEETPYYTGIHRSNPIVKTFDLGYVYKFNQAIVPFENPIENGPKRYDIIVSHSLKEGYIRADEFAAKSSEYVYPIQRFPVPVEGRWIQIIVDDWFSNRPKLKASDFKVGIQYENHTPVRTISSEYNRSDLFKLSDLIINEHSKWTAAQKRTEEIKEGKEKKKKISFTSPEEDIIVTFNLGDIVPIYGTRITSDGPGNNLKHYEILTSTDGNQYITAYVSPELKDNTVSDLFIPPEKINIRYARLKIKKGDWYGDYPEIREFEFFTDSYKPILDEPQDINQYNAQQVYYDDCGHGNTLSPNLIQGFSFDRGVGQENRYLYPQEELEPGNTPSERSFCYHYDKIVFQYNDLLRDALYWVQVTYLQPKNGSRLQMLNVDGFILHGCELEIPKGKAESYTFSIPKIAYADGNFRLNFCRLAGDNAVVSEVKIFEARPQVKADFVKQALNRAIKVSEPVTIDGNLEEWPTLYSLTPQSIGSDAIPIKVYLQWDENNLYIGSEVDRTSLKKSTSNKRLDKDEISELLGNLHLFIDTAANRSPGIYRTTDHHLWFYRIGSRDYKKYAKVAQIHHHLDAISANIPDRKEIEFAQTFNKDGYILEARIPGKEVLQEFQPDIGKKIGFNFILSNRLIDNIGWSTDKISASPNKWGTVELVSQIKGKIFAVNEKTKEQILSFNANNPIVICVLDSDRNTNREEVETIQVELNGNITADKEELTLTESDPINYQSNPNSDLFSVKLPTNYSLQPVQDDKKLQIVGNEIVTLTYTDPYYAPGQENKDLKVELKVNVGTDGEILILNESGEKIEEFRAGYTLLFEVRDDDLSEKNKSEGENPPKNEKNKEDTDNQKPEKENPENSPTAALLDIELRVKETDEFETVSIEDSKEQKLQGSIKTEYSIEPIPNDGILQVAGTQNVIATYIDEIQKTGQTDVPVTVSAKVEVGDTGILSIVSGIVKLQNKDKIQQSISGNIPEPEQSTSPDFTAKFNAGTELQLKLKDIDLNKNSSEKDSIEITSKGNMLNDQLKLVLEETDIATGEFTGVCKTTYATEADIENSLLEIKGNEKVRFTYLDALQGTGATNIPVQTSAQVNVGEDGILSIVRSNYITDIENFNAGDVLYFRLQDTDEINNIEPPILTVVGNRTNDKLVVELRQTSPTSGVFLGSIRTEYGKSAINDDTILQVQGNEKIIVVYLDKLRSTGETNVSVSDYAKVNTGYTGKFFVYRKGDIGKPIDKFKAGETLILEVEDFDLSRTNAVAELFETNSSEDMVRDNIRVSMRELSGNAGIFRGEIKTEYGQRAIPNDNILQVQGLGVVTLTYVDALQDTGKTQVPITVQLTVETGEKGNLELYSADGSYLIASPEIGIGSFSAGDTLTVKLSDNDLNKEPMSLDSAKVEVIGNVLEDEVSLQLVETANNSGVFEGKLLTEYSNNYNIIDEILQVTDKELVTVQYIDEIVTTGETNVAIEAKAVVLSSNPGILLIVDENYQELGSFNAGRAIYFLLEDLLLSTVEPIEKAKIVVSGNRTNDRVTLNLDKVIGEEGLFYGMLATRYGKTPIDDNTLDVQGGEKITATYQPNFPGVYNLTVEDSTYVNKGNRGEILIVKNDGTPVYNFNPGAMLYFRLEDQDLNKDPFGVDFTDIWVSTDSERTPVESIGNYVSLKEEGENSGIFVGSLKTEHGRSAQALDVLGLVGGEIVKATYIDEIVDTGETNVEITDTCRANLIGWATYAKEKVIIDGIPDKWPMETVLATEQNEALMWVQWDRNNLYILAQLYDDEVVVTDATKWYEGGNDAIEIHIDLSPDDVQKPNHLRKSYDKDEFIFWLCPKGAGFDGVRPYIGQYEPEYIPNYIPNPPIQIGIRYHLDENKPRYILEAAIPFSSALKGFDPMKTTRIDKIGFNYIIYRSDAPIVIWAKPAEGWDSQQLSKLGTLYLERPKER